MYKNLRISWFSLTLLLWRWRQDCSHDKGETWIEGIGLIAAERRGR